MNKKDLLKSFDIASFVAICIATVLVMVFQFTGVYLVLKFAIIMYAASFLILVVLLSFNVHAKFAKKKPEQVEVEENSKNQEIEEPIAKKQKVLSIVWLVLAAIAFVLTCVLLALY